MPYLVSSKFQEFLHDDSLTEDDGRLIEGVLV